jgi:hypothetical protein
VIIKLEHGGKSYAYDDESLTVLQGIAVEEHIKGTLIDFDHGLGTHRSDCYQALGWLIFHDGSPEVPIASVDFPIVKVSQAWLAARLAVVAEMKAALAAAEAEAEAGETPPAKAAPAGPTGGPGSGAPSGNTSARSRRPSGTSPPTSTPSASESSTT